MRLVIGRLGKPHGVRGQISVQVRTDAPEERFAVGTRVVTDPPDRGPLTVTGAHWHSGRLLLSFAGVADRGAAERLRGTMLVVDSTALPELADPDEFYDHQLVGLRAQLAGGERLGVVTDVIHSPGGDLLVVRRDGAEPGGGSASGQAAPADHDATGAATAGAAATGAGEAGAVTEEVLVPFRAEVVPTVDLAAGFVVVAPPEGLLEL